MKKNISKYKKGILFALGGLATLSVISIVAASCAKPLVNIDSINSYFKVPVQDNTQGFHTQYQTMSNEGKRAFVLGGYKQPLPLLAGLENNSFNKDSIGLLIDTGFDEKEANRLKNIKEKLSRVGSVVFKVEEAAFLAGIAAAYQLNTNQERFLKDKKGLTWGGYVGINTSSTTPFLVGFDAGVKWANEKLANMQIKQSGTNLTKTYIEVKQQLPENNSSSVFSFDPGKGKDVVQEFIDKDIDVLLAVAGELNLVMQFKN